MGVTKVNIHRFWGSGGDLPKAAPASRIFQSSIKAVKQESTTGTLKVLTLKSSHEGVRSQIYSTNGEIQLRSIQRT